MPAKTAPSAKTSQPKRKFTLSTRLKIVDLLHPHWTPLTLAFIAVLGETLTDVLEPWPVKIVVDNLLQHKRLPGWIERPVIALFGDNQIAILNFAVGAVAAIAVVGALSSYAEKYLTTSVSPWVTHDLRRMLYGHIQRLSLAEYDETRTGDLISRVTSDINAVQDFVNTALLGMIWQPTIDVNQLNLFYGVGGKEDAPDPNAKY